VLGNKNFAAGAFVGDNPDSKWNPDAYRQQMEYITKNGGTPVIIQSYGLTGQPEPEIIAAYEALARDATVLLLLNWGKCSRRSVKIYSLETFGEIMAIPQCRGAKHSSLNRSLEWQRLALRNAKRPDFKIYTGNDLAIDMVITAATTCWTEHLRAGPLRQKGPALGTGSPIFTDIMICCSTR